MVRVGGVETPCGAADRAPCGVAEGRGVELAAGARLLPATLRTPRAAPAGGAAGGLHATDVSNASRTNLMDLQALSWHQPTLELFGVAPRMLPQIRSNAEVYGCEGRRGDCGVGWERPGMRMRCRLAMACACKQCLHSPRHVSVPLHAAPSRTARWLVCPSPAAWATSRRRWWGSAARCTKPKTHTALVSGGPGAASAGGRTQAMPCGAAGQQHAAQLLPLVALCPAVAFCVTARCSAGRPTADAPHWSALLPSHPPPPTHPHHQAASCCSTRGRSWCSRATAC